MLGMENLKQQSKQGLIPSICLYTRHVKEELSVNSFNPQAIPYTYGKVNSFITQVSARN